MPKLSAQQKVDRRKGIGASDVAELLGLSPFEGKSPMRLYAEKNGLLPEAEEEEETIEQKVGHALEGAMVGLYERESGFRVLTSGEYVETVVHPTEAWARCNLDGRIVDKRASLEVKIVGIGMARDWDVDSDDGIPPYVRTQCVWQMFVADLDEVHVVALVNGTHFRVFYVVRDRELEAAIVADAREWWQRTMAGKLPPIDGTLPARRLLESMYPPPPTEVEVQIEDDDPLATTLYKRVVAADSENRAKEAKEIYNNAIREGMGKLGATVVYSSSVRATWRKSKDGKRPLLVAAIGASKIPRIEGRKPDINHVPVIDDGEAF